MNYKNPTRELVIEDYPLGGNKRGKCVFRVESNKRGERVMRQTFGKPKYTTYAVKCAIVEGEEDGRTYILQLTEWGSVNVERSDFMSHEYVTGGERLVMLRQLLDGVQ